MLILLGLAAAAGATGLAVGKWIGPTVKSLLGSDQAAPRVIRERQYLEYREVPNGGNHFEPASEVYESAESQDPNAYYSGYEQPGYETPAYADPMLSAGGCSPRVATRTAGGSPASTVVPNAPNDLGRPDVGNMLYWEAAAAGDAFLGSLADELNPYFDGAALLTNEFAATEGFRYDVPPAIEETVYITAPQSVSVRRTHKAAPGRYPVAPAVFQHAREVAEEPDMERTSHFAEHTAGGSDGEAVVKRGILPAVLEGSHDPPVWVQLSVGDYELMVTAEPIAVNGLRLPTTWADQIEIARTLGAMPITKVVSDARWAAGKQILARPIPNTGKPQDTITYNEMIGPNTGVLTDGYQKEGVLHPQLAATGEGAMAQYGFRKAGGATIQQGFPGIHNEYHADYSNTPTYMSNQGTYKGQPVNMIDELERGGPLGGPIPKWLTNRLRGGVS